jgi:Putative transposase
MCTASSRAVGLAPNGKRWVACKPGFFLPVRVLSRLFRRRFLEQLDEAHRSGRLQFFGEFVGLADARAFAAWLAPLRACEWVVYAKRPFAGPAAVLAYLSRYTHRVAISNQRLLALDERGVTFRWKDYRATGRTRHKTMTLASDEFIRRFLLHVLPGGFHRIRHYGLLANTARREHLARARELLHVVPAAAELQPPTAAANVQPTFVCPHCGAAMIIVETFARGQPIRAPPTLRAAA